jgi:hypothetical protein
MRGVAADRYEERFGNRHGLGFAVHGERGIDGRAAR